VHAPEGTGHSKKKEQLLKHFLWASTVLSTAILTACGGGGSSDEPAPGPAPLALTGVAATGAPISGQTVEAKCSSGTGTATSNADGSYTISVTGGVLPCVLKITPATGPALYSVATGTGSSATANISPVTHLVVASLTGGDPAAYFTGFDATAAAGVTDAKVTAAVTAVKETLTAAGVDLGTIDVLAGTLPPAAGTTAGNAYDQALDALAAKLTTTGTTLTTLTTTVAATSPAAPSTAPAATTGVASLPADLLLKPAASTCPALRSGSYRMVLPKKGSNLAEQTGTITIDAQTLSLTYTDGSTGTWAPTDGACHFTDDGGKTDMFVTQAGVIVARYTDDDGASYAAGIGLPVQTHALASLAGTWNSIGLSINDAGTAYTAVTGTVTVDGAGVLSGATWCQNDETWGLTGADCAPVTGTVGGLRANADGGFDSLDPGSTTAFGRLFAYRAGNGDLMLVSIDGDGTLLVFTQKRTNMLPTLGVTNTTWNVNLNPQLAAPAPVGLSSNTIQSVDAAAGSWVRQQHFANGADYSETLFANNPRDGYTFRPAATTTAVGGAPVEIREFDTLGLRGMGFSAVVIPSTKTLAFSVNQP
jgi:hypothetical protein